MGQLTSDYDQEFVLSDATVRFTIEAHSDRGAVRRVNEDSFLARAPIFVVADGMGGHAFGDRASKVAIDAFAEAFVEERPTAPQLVLDTIRRANHDVVAISGDSGSGRTVSGTTLAGVALVEVGESGLLHWMTFNVGDSRVYEWDGRTLAQVSVDHSAVQELIDLGQISVQDAETHPERNVITRALGAGAEVDADIWLVPARAHQTFLICSDGLTKELRDDEIARIIAFHRAEGEKGDDELAPTLARRLVSAAIAAGGSDNVTVVVVEADVSGVAVASETDDTIDRTGMPKFLEETRPRR